MNKQEREELLILLEEGFAQNMNRHEGVQWTAVRARLAANPEELAVLHEMERRAASRMWLVMIRPCF